MIVGIVWSANARVCVFGAAGSVAPGSALLGESYISAPTMHAVDRIKTLRTSVAVYLSVPVAAIEAAEPE